MDFTDMATVQEIANWVIESFDRTLTTTVERACEDALRHHGASQFAAATEASEKARRVLALLHSKNAAELPFEFSERSPNRLVGKQRLRADDSPETKTARQALALVPDVLAAIYACGNCTFEKICAGLMLLSGAEEAFAGCASDDGGIDVYGRIPLRLSDERVRAGVLRTSLLDRSLFFLGQCKCYEPSISLGPGEIQQFIGSVEACLNQYEHNPKPPSHRVPKAYYRRGETSVSIFFTTGSFTQKAKATAEAYGTILVTGTQIAEFLTLHRIAITIHGDGTLAVSQSALREWANVQKPLIHP